LGVARLVEGVPGQEACPDEYRDHTTQALATADAEAPRLAGTHCCPITQKCQQIKLRLCWLVSKDVQKISIAAKIPSLGRGAAGREVAGRGFYAIFDKGY